MRSASKKFVIHLNEFDFHDIGDVVVLIITPTSCKQVQIKDGLLNGDLVDFTEDKMIKEYMQNNKFATRRNAKLAVKTILKLDNTLPRYFKYYT